MESPEIGFPVFRLGEDAKAMWGIGERPRRRRKAGKPTFGAHAGFLDGVAARFRYPVSLRGPLLARKPDWASQVVPYKLDSL